MSHELSTSERGLELQDQRDPIPGLVEILSTTSFRLRLEREPGGCWNVAAPFAQQVVESGSVFNLEEQASRGHLPLPTRVVRSAGARLHDGPSTLPTKRRLIGAIVSG